MTNITFQGDHDNKGEYSDKPPSQYIRECEQENPNIEQTLSKHLIGDLQDFGILDDNYEKFIEERTNFIWKEIQSRIAT